MHLIPIRWSNALIFGAGPIGMLMALCLRTRGVNDVTMVDLDESRLLLAESFGLTAIAAGSTQIGRYEKISRYGSRCYGRAKGS